ncbi:MAG: hypothetical protein LBE35_05600, partial [Clostridiales bacterium]|nr:hypothetical protein [Clostridiales bacterium]
KRERELRNKTRAHEGDTIALTSLALKSASEQANYVKNAPKWAAEREIFTKVLNKHPEAKAFFAAEKAKEAARRAEWEAKERVEQAKRDEDRRIMLAKIAAENEMVRKLSAISLLTGLASFFGPIISIILAEDEIGFMGGGSILVTVSIVGIVLGVISLICRSRAAAKDNYNFGIRMANVGRVFAILGLILAGILMLVAGCSGMRW